MTDWEVLRFVHPIGSRLSGTVVQQDALIHLHGLPAGNLTVKTTSGYPALLPYAHLSEDPSSFSEILLPAVGQDVQAVIFNCVGGTLYLSAKPSDLADEQVQAWSAFYQYIDTIELGTVVQGTVTKSRPFGLFVDLGEPYEGLIDIGCAPLDEGRRLPQDRTAWPREGDEIRCQLSYLRLHDRMLGLYWLPDQDRG